MDQQVPPFVNFDGGGSAAANGFKSNTGKSVPGSYTGPSAFNKMKQYGQNNTIKEFFMNFLNHFIRRFEQENKK